MNISISGLTVQAGRKTILDNISGTFPSGKITVITGHNGCGKSTLLKALAGILPVKCGNIFLDGQEITAISPIHLARKRAIMLQHPAVPALMTVREYLRLARYAQKKDKKEDIQALEQALADTASDHLAGRFLDTLSGGELRRIHLAFALAQNPELLLLDEPEAGLDAASKAGLPKLLKKLQQQRQLTIIAVIHDLDMALHCADELTGMQNGSISWQTRLDIPELPEILQKFTGGNFDFFTGKDGSLRALPRFK
ncbi:MAG: ABC transporter ATP-binding protein [Lentisphaerae bacterium]|nr:ABC transporter ATP-binding protein [Lentisphaerota bacterium]